MNVVGWVPDIDGPGRIVARTILMNRGVDRVLEMDIQFDDAEDWIISYWDSSTAPSETYYNIRVIALMNMKYHQNQIKFMYT